MDVEVSQSGLTEFLNAPPGYGLKGLVLVIYIALIFFIGMYCWEAWSRRSAKKKKKDQ